MIHLNRSTFALAVFKRDKHKCVICGEKAVDAHHIVDRSLFKDGGYYLDNGASLCTKCHWRAEVTTLSCTTIRTLARIQHIVLPENFDPNIEIDKWGNPILTSGQRLKGPLFYQPNVQKVLRIAGLLNLFSQNSD